MVNPEAIPSTQQSQQVVVSAPQVVNQQSNQPVQNVSNIPQLQGITQVQASSMTNQSVIVSSPSTVAPQGTFVTLHQDTAISKDTFTADHANASQTLSSEQQHDALTPSSPKKQLKTPAQTVSPDQNPGQPQVSETSL